MYDRILVPTDGSTGTAHVALQALDLAAQYGGTVHALSVVDTDVSTLLSEAGSGTQRLRARAEKAVTTVQHMAGAHDVEVVTEIREGDPAETILAYAEEIDADLVVAGTHGRSGVRRHLLGSVAERVVRHAHCPVMTVRLPDTDVTVDDADEARELLTGALADAGYESSRTSIERQLSVWVAEAETDEGRVVAYLDPRTRRTSVHPQ
jgi:nucleotide-binding universal stress UspA family protein